MTRADDKCSWAEHPSPCPQGDGHEEALPTRQGTWWKPKPLISCGLTKTPCLKITDWGWISMLTGPRHSWQWYHLWEIVVWTTVWLHFPSCEADMPQSTLLLWLMCFLIPTHMWHPAWRSLIIWKFEQTELQRNTLNTSRNIVPPSQGQKSVHKHLEWFWISQRESIECKLTSALHFRKPGLASHSSESRCCPQSRLCFVPLELPGAFSLKCFCPLSAFAFTTLFFMVVLIQCSLSECPSWSTGSDFYRVTFWLEHWLAPYPDRW